MLVLRRIGFALSLVCTMVLGIQLAFTVYALPVKVKFNFTQTEVEYLASASMAGMGVSFIQAFLTHRLGHMITYGITLAAGVISVLLLTIAADKHEFFSKLPLLVAFFQFLMSATFRMSLWMLSSIAVRNFSTKHTGKITSAYFAFVGLGKAFYITLYTYGFSKNVNVAGFFLCVTITYAVLFSLCIIFHRPITDSQLQTEQNSEEKRLVLPSEKQPISEDSDEKHVEISTGDSAKHFSLKDILLNPFFQLMVWTSSLFYSCVYSYLNNLTTMLRSMGFEKSDMFIYIMSVTIATTRLSAGAIFDWLGTLRLRFILLLFCYSSFITAIILNLVWFEIPWVAIIATICGGISIGLANCIPIAMLSTYFGKENYSVMSGAMYFLVAVLCVIIQVCTGLMYDSKVTTEAGTAMFCYGRDCFLGPFILLLCLAVLVVPVQVVNMCLHS